MASSHLLRLGTIKSKNGVLVAMQHNKRTLQVERGASANVDATRTSLNYSIASDNNPEAIALQAKIDELSRIINGGEHRFCRCPASGVLDRLQGHGDIRPVFRPQGKACRTGAGCADLTGRRAGGRPGRAEGHA